MQLDADRELLNQRELDLSERESQFRELEQLRAEILSITQTRDQLQSERDSLVAALREMQARFAEVRGNIEAAEQTGSQESADAYRLEGTSFDQKSDEGSLTEEHILQEVYQLRDDLQRNRENAAELQGGYESQLVQKDRELNHLRGQLREAEDALAAAMEASSMQDQSIEASIREKFSVEIQELRSQLETREDTIRELRNHLQAITATMNRDEKQTEFDHHFDTRRQESQEQGLDNDRGDEGDEENYRINELSANWQGSREIERSDTAAVLPAVSELRQELASLFGLQSKKSVPSEPDVFVDLSVPAASTSEAGVELSFQGASGLLMADPGVDETCIAVKGDDEAPDFVKSYMEELLNRSRKSAGVTLPSELQNNSGRKDAGNRQAPEQKPKVVKSFLEEYMAGGFQLSSGSSVPVSSSPASHDSEVGQQPLPAPHSRIDREKLRENMNSFRTVSTQSVEHALAKAADRKQKHNINGRIVFVVVLSLLSILQVIAFVSKVVDSSLLMWATLAATAASVAELVRKICASPHKTRTATITKEQLLALTASLEKERMSEVTADSHKQNERTSVSDGAV